MTRTKEQLIIENEELRARLAETEETLAAIQSGEVDAIVVSSSKGEQVYSISSAETPYRTFIEEMNEGALTLTKNGIILFCNKRFAEFVNEPIERVIGSYFNNFIVPNDKSKFDHLLAHLAQNKNDVLIVSLTNSLYLKLSSLLLPSYLQGDNCIIIATDISEMKKEEKKLLELHRLLAKKIDVIQDLRIQLVNKKIENEVEIHNLKITNKKLVKEITKQKPAETGFKQKLTQKRTTSLKS